VVGRAQHRGDMLEIPAAAAACALALLLFALAKKANKSNSGNDAGKHKTTTAKRKVCIIGGGAAGISACKAVLDEFKTPQKKQPLGSPKERKEQGEQEEELEVVLYEASGAGTGGLWRSSGSSEERNYSPRAGIYDSLRTNLSRVTMSFSDFPMPESFPVTQIGHADVFAYLESYSEHFGVDRHVRLGCEVVDVRPHVGGGGDDDDERRGWDVSVRDTSLSSPPQVEQFDAVIVATGGYGRAKFPRAVRELRKSQQHPASDDTSRQPTGEARGVKIWHSSEYRRPEQFGAGERVLIIGGGHSAGEIGGEIARLSPVDEVVMVSRRPFVPMPKLSANGLPFDWGLNRVILGALPAFLMERFFRKMVGSRLPEVRAAGLPVADVESAPVWSLALMITEEPICQLAREGRLRAVLGEVGSCTADGHATLADGTDLGTFQHVVCCTGFHLDLPFFSAELQEAGDLPRLTHDDSMLEGIYEHLFWARDPTLAVIGLPLNTFPNMVFELQSLWIASVLRGSVQLPTEEAMLQVERERTLAADAAGKPQGALRRRIEGLGTPYCDMIARQLGMYPSLWQLGTLFGQAMLGPISGSFYRIAGSRTWPGARRVVRQNYELKKQTAATAAGADHEKST
jgi:Flavin-binding monooxygenase-like